MHGTDERTDGQVQCLMRSRKEGPIIRLSSNLVYLQGSTVVSVDIAADTERVVGIFVFNVEQPVLE